MTPPVLQASILCYEFIVKPTNLQLFDGIGKKNICDTRCMKKNHKKMLILLMLKAWDAFLP